MNTRRHFVLEGLRQAGLVLLLLLCLWVLVGLLMYGSFSWFGMRDHGGIFDVFYRVGALTEMFAAGALCGPVPTLLTYLDVSDKQLLIFSCVLIIPYWGILGTIAGLLRWGICVRTSELSQIALSKQNNKYTRWTIELMAVVLGTIFFVWGPLVRPPLNSGRYSAGSVRNSVINNLRQIDAAKNELALEKKLPPDYVPTEADLAPYLTGGTNYFNRPGSSLRHVLNPINKPPYAILDSDWRFRRRGLSEGFVLTNGTVFRLP
jgi:hypothetical protein